MEFKMFCCLAAIVTYLFSHHSPGCFFLALCYMWYCESLTLVHRRDEYILCCSKRNTLLEMKCDQINLKKKLLKH